MAGTATFTLKGIAQFCPAPVKPGRKGINMEKSFITETIRKREEAIRRIAANQDRELIRRGAEAYSRDLPELLARRMQSQIVAYRGDEQVAIAPTYKKLDRILAKRGIKDEQNLFVASIAPLPDDDVEERGR